MNDDDRVTIEQVAICLDRFYTRYRVDASEGDERDYFEAVQGMSAEAVVGSVDGWLMTSKWFPRPADFRECSMARMREMALDTARKRVSVDCQVCHGNQWAPSTPVVRNGMTYDMSAPCEECNPQLYAKWVEINAERESFEARSTPKDMSFPFRVSDKIAQCRDVLAEVKARMEAER